MLSLAAERATVAPRCPKHNTDSSSVALLSLLEMVAGNQSAVRIFRLLVTVWTSTLKQLSDHADARPAFCHPEAAGALSEKSMINKDNLGKLWVQT